MREVEVKILDINIRKVERKIKNLGGILVHKNILYKELYFEKPEKDVKFSSTRIRTEGSKVYWTMKFKKGNNTRFLTREELEIQVSDFETALRMMKEIGLRPLGLREKYRKKYKVGNISIELDQYPKIPPYMEIEGKNQKNVEAFLHKLGFDLKYTVRNSATEIIKQYGVNPNNLVFKKKVV